MRSLVASNRSVMRTVGIQVNRNVFGYQVHEARKLIVETSKTVRGQMLIGAIDNFATHLDRAYDDVTGPSDDVTSDGEGWMSDGLRHFASKTIFNAIFATVFGQVDQHVFNSDMVFTNFETFHK